MRLTCISLSLPYDRDPRFLQLFFCKKSIQWFCSAFLSQRAMFLRISVCHHKWKRASFQAAASNQTTPNVTTLSEKAFDLSLAQGHLEETPDVMKSALGPFITKAQNKMHVDCSQKYMSVRKIFLPPIFLRSTQMQVIKNRVARRFSQNRTFTTWVAELNESQVDSPPQRLHNVKPTDFPHFC